VPFLLVAVTASAAADFPRDEVHSRLVRGRAARPRAAANRSLYVYIRSIYIYIYICAQHMVNHALIRKP
jgi:hypothetical protein